MAATSNLWKTQIEGVEVEIEVWSSGLFTAGVALFIDNIRIDHVSHFFAWTRFTIRGYIEKNEKRIAVVAKIHQGTFGTKATLTANNVEVALTTIR